MGVPPLTIDPKLNQWAQRWANNMVSRGFRHSRPGAERLKGTGENIFTVSIAPLDARWTKRTSGQYVTDDFYNEDVDFTHGQSDYSDCTGHYTQIIWKATKRMGVGYAEKPAFQGRGKQAFIVFQYSPGGNVVGRNWHANLPAAKQSDGGPDSWEKCHMGNKKCPKGQRKCPVERSRGGRDPDYPGDDSEMEEMEEAGTPQTGIEVPPEQQDTIDEAQERVTRDTSALVEGTPTATGQATNPAVVGATPVGTPAVAPAPVGTPAVGAPALGGVTSRRGSRSMTGGRGNKKGRNGKNGRGRGNGRRRVKNRRQGKNGGGGGRGGGRRLGKGQNGRNGQMNKGKGGNGGRGGGQLNKGNRRNGGKGGNRRNGRSKKKGGKGRRGGGGRKGGINKGNRRNGRKGGNGRKGQNGKNGGNGIKGRNGIKGGNGRKGGNRTKGGNRGKGGKGGNRRGSRSLGAKAFRAKGGGSKKGAAFFINQFKNTVLKALEKNIAKPALFKPFKKTVSKALSKLEKNLAKPVA